MENLPESGQDSFSVSLSIALAGIETNWLCSGLDFPVHSTLAIVRNEALEFWDWIMDHTGTGPSGFASYTAELHILADTRVIFTADPENTKALLTTQFQDFGKGA